MSLDVIPACIDQVATQFADRPSEGEIQRARTEYDTRRGRIYDDDELFESHMASFLEWFVLERAMDHGAPPAVLALRDDATEQPEAELLRALAASHRSLFEMLQQRPRSVQLMDLIGGGRWRVDQDQPMEGLERGDILEARLVPWQGGVVFGPVFCFHPRAARGCIMKLIEEDLQQGGPGPDLVFDLAEMRLRYSRFRNIAVDHIYTRDSRTRHR